MVGALGWVEVELEGRGHNCGFVCDGGDVTDSELRASPPAAAPARRAAPYCVFSRRVAWRRAALHTFGARWRRRRL